MRTRRSGRVEVGVISDTHGLLRPEALAALRGVDHILHAGDIGAPEVLQGLRDVAPVTAVRGNNDRAAWARGLPETEAVELGSVWFYLIHDRNGLDIDPAAAGFRAVVCGHSHRPAQEERDGVLFFNPGSAGPRRFALPVGLGRLTIGPSGIGGRLVQLDV